MKFDVPTALRSYRPPTAQQLAATLKSARFDASSMFAAAKPVKLQRYHRWHGFRVPDELPQEKTMLLDIVQEYPDVLDRGLWEVAPVTAEHVEQWRKYVGRFHRPGWQDYRPTRLNVARLWSEVVPIFWPMWVEHLDAAGDIHPEDAILWALTAFTRCQLPEMCLPLDRWVAMLEACGFACEEEHVSRPTEPLRLYRGHAKGYELGMAWTPDETLASAYANNRARYSNNVAQARGLEQSHRPCVSTALVDPERILGRNVQENSYIVNPLGLDVETKAHTFLGLCVECGMHYMECSVRPITNEPPCCESCDHEHGPAVKV